MESIVKIIDKLVNTKEVPKRVYSSLRSMGLLPGVKQTDFIRAMRSLETPMNVKHYLMSAYLDNNKHRLKNITQTIRPSHVAVRPFVIKIKSKQLRFYDSYKKRFIATPIKPHDNWYSHKGRVLSTKVFQDEESMEAGAFINDLLHWINYISILNRACARWAQWKAGHYEGNMNSYERKYIEDRNFIKSLKMDDDFRPHYEDVIRNAEKIKSVISRFGDERMNELMNELTAGSKDVIHELNTMEEYKHAVDDRELAELILDRTRPLDQTLAKLADRALDLDYSKFDVSDLRSNFKLPEIKSIHMTKTARTKSVSDLKYIKQLIKPE